MAVSAAEISSGTTLAAGAGFVDLVSAAFSGTGVGALVLVGLIGLTAVGAAEAEFGLTTGVGSVMYFAKDLKDFQSSGTDDIGRMTSKQATDAAKDLGYSKTNQYSNGQPVYKKGNKYITPDVDSHNGGDWKMADSIEDLGSKSTRMGTYDANLVRIGD